MSTPLSTILARKNWCGVGRAKPITHASNVMRSRGESLSEVFWQGRQWVVTAYGIERRDGSYHIEASRLREDHTGGAVDQDGNPVPYTWIGHIGEKAQDDPSWDLDDFATAFFVACAMHCVKLSPAEVEMLRDQYGWRWRRPKEPAAEKPFRQSSGEFVANFVPPDADG